jgi:hypothetical protein
MGRFVRLSYFCATVSAPLSAGWLAEVKRLHGKKQPLSSGGLHALQFLLSAFPISAFHPSPARTAETLSVERIPNVECGMQSAE